ncbi:hypothetical protein [Maribacter sp. 4G9]|uniref:hypothetical protein n=1 Tax=Maribacter sp. 4G9 TaxID=1889777 RepID=UPI000C15436D|nr:hypothetical protein [Maribacter sp. 4G9]PIB27290.1 hypothetical protein BFP75_07330 [Maribacter sp. 4G9]
MKLISIRRRTKKERRYTKKMGVLYTDVTYIKKYALGFPFKTLHKYRGTYYGKIKGCEDCVLAN